VLGGEVLGTLDVEDRLQRLPLQRGEPARELGVPPPQQPSGEVSLRGSWCRGRHEPATAVISGRAADGGGRGGGRAQQSQR
jgi:hypothetical protein